jgi:Holliday junction resolvase RusA-like endonuclease
MGKQSVRGKGSQFYMPPKTREYMNKIKYYAKNIYKGEPLAIPLSVELTFCFPNAGHRLKPKHSDIWQCQKPDLDNLEKAFFDGIQGVILEDDCWVVDKKSSKVWGESYGIWLLVVPASSK